MKLVPSFEAQSSKQISQIAIIIWLIEILLIFSTWSLLPPQVPLFYSRPWGEEQLVHPIGLFLLPALGLVTFLINFWIISLLPKEEKLLRQILIITILVFNLLSLITLIQIIRIAL